MNRNLAASCVVAAVIGLLSYSLFLGFPTQFAAFSHALASSETQGDTMADEAAFGVGASGTTHGDHHAKSATTPSSTTFDGYLNTTAPNTSATFGVDEHSNELRQSAVSMHPLVASRCAGTAKVSAACDTRALVSAALDGSVVWRLSGSNELEVDAASAHCAPNNVSRDDVAAALDGEHLLFIGDSVTRFQYLSLAYFLETGRWGTTPSMTWRSGWGTWSEYIRGTNAVLGGREICDCYRQEKSGAEQIRENRFYAAPGFRTRVSVVKWMGDAPIVAHNFSALNERCIEAAFRESLLQESNLSATSHPDRSCPQGLCAPGECVGTVGDEWSGEFWEVVPSVVAYLRPSVVIINAGLWRFPLRAGEDDRLVDMLINMVNKSSSSQPPRVIWKTTTLRAAHVNVRKRTRNLGAGKKKTRARAL